MRKEADGAQSGACLRCWYFKESCDTNDQCLGCKSHSPTWPHDYCIRMNFKDMWSHLQPPQIGKHLEDAHISAFYSQNCREPDCSEQVWFVLKISWGLGKPFEIKVTEIEPSPKITKQDSIKICWYTRNHVEITTCPLNSPPMMVDLSSEAQMLDIQDKIKALVNDELNNKDAAVIWQCFWDEEGDTHEEWHRGVFFAIWRYHQPNIEEHKMLSEALRYLILIYFMNKSLVVQDVSGLLCHLRTPWKYDASVPFSPNAIARAIKMCAYQLVKYLARATVKNLQFLVQNKSESCMSKDLTFCLAFICLAVLAKNQAAALGLELIRGEEGMTYAETVALILQMEAKFTESIIKLCQCKFNPSQKPSSPGPQCQSQGEAHAADEGLLRQIEEHTFAAGDDLHICTEIDDDLSDFFASNTKRVLVKFIDRVFPQWIVPRTSAPLPNP